MATGDMQNNLRKLCADLKKMRVPPHLFRADELASGNNSVFLNIFDYLLQWKSPALSHLINNKGLKPLSLDENKTKFLEGVYLIFREIFSWKPPLTTAQFMSNGFLEKKVIMCSEVLKLVDQKDQELEPKTVRKPSLDVSHSGLKLVFNVPKNQKTGKKNTDSKANISCISEEQELKQDVANGVNHNKLKLVFKHKTGEENMKNDSKVSISHISQKQFLKLGITDSNFLANEKLDKAEILPSDKETAKSIPVDNFHQRTANISNNKNPLSAEWDKFQCSILDKIAELETRLSLNEERITFLENRDSRPKTSEDRDNAGDREPNSHEPC